MSIIIKNEKGNAVVYTKGADSSILKRLKTIDNI